MKKLNPPKRRKDPARVVRGYASQLRAAANASANGACAEVDIRTAQIAADLLDAYAQRLAQETPKSGAPDQQT